MADRALLVILHTIKASLSVEIGISARRLMLKALRAAPPFAAASHSAPDSQQQCRPMSGPLCCQRANQGIDQAPLHLLSALEARG